MHSRLGVNNTLVTSMLQFYSVNVYSLLDPRDTLSLVKPLVVMKFYVLFDVFIKPFSVFTPMGYFVVAKSVYRKLLVMLPIRVNLAD